MFFLVLVPNFYHFQIHLLEDTSTLKFTLKHQDGTWCENIIVPELRLLGNTTTNDHLVISFEQGKKSGGHLLVYFSCIPKGRLHLPYSLKEMNHQVKHSKVNQSIFLALPCMRQPDPYTVSPC